MANAKAFLVFELSHTYIEEFTEEEINEIIVSHVDEDVLQSFDEYYFVNRGKYLEALKQQQEVKEELEDQQYEE